MVLSQQRYKSKILFDYNFIIRTCPVWKNDCMCKIPASILFVSEQMPCCIQKPSLKFADDRLARCDYLRLLSLYHFLHLGS